MKTKSNFIMCDCESEVLRIVIDEDAPNDVYLAIYKNYNTHMSLAQKFRYIWRVLVHGKPYEDQMVISKEKAMKLAKALVGLR